MSFMDPFDYEDFLPTNVSKNIVDMNIDDVMMNVAGIICNSKSISFSLAERTALVKKLHEIVFGSRVNKTHELPQYEKKFLSVVNGTKTFEIRENEKDYRVGDKLWFKEFSLANNRYTGRGCLVLVTHIEPSDAWPLTNTCAMSIKLLEDNRPFPVR